ncbi:MAG: STAS/SEC14 domain-containing protein [Chloroflexi bacterium]|nr:STAS/SEC14 domain-containing protein [Chloroflexota bacterium]
MEAEEIVIRTSTVRMESQGLVRITHHPGAVQTLDDAQAIAAVVNTLMQGQQGKLLIDMRRIKSQDREVREYYTQQGYTIGLQAVAILIGSPVSRVIGNLYIGFNKSEIPTRLFTSEAEAIAWLRELPLAGGADSNHS